MGTYEIDGVMVVANPLKSLPIKNKLIENTNETALVLLK
jgi:hypothetical protein